MRLKSKLANIVFVEDYSGDVAYVKSVLKQNKVNFNFYVCRDGTEILDFLYKRGLFVASVSPDLIVLDLSLPKMSGEHILRLLKRDKQLRIIPIAILSGSEVEDDIAESYKQGACFYMTKPFKVDVFLTLIEKTPHLALEKEDDSLNVIRFGKDDC